MSMPSYEESSRTRQTTRRRRIVFELPVAEQTLPLVRRVLADIVQSQAKLNHLRLKISKNRCRNQSWSSKCEGFRAEDQIQKLEQLLAEYKQELTDLGVKLLDGAHGVVGYPTIVNGSLAYLVFRHEDDGIWYWRYRDQPKLRPIPDCWYDQNPFPEEENEGLLV